MNAEQKQLRRLHVAYTPLCSLDQGSHQEHTSECLSLLLCAVQVDSLMVHSEITAQLSPRAPHYATLPAPSEVFSFYNLPLQYAPVLQHPHTVG